MAPSPATTIAPATPQEIGDLRAGAEKELGVMLTPQLPRQVLLPSTERANLFDELQRQGFTVTEIKNGKADLGYLARATKFEDNIATLPACAISSEVDQLAGQRFAYHSCTALAFNLRYGVSLRTPMSQMHEDTASNVFFMGKTLREQDGAPLTTYSERGVVPILEQSGITITDTMRELDSIQLLLAIDLRGYGELTNRLNKDFIGMRYDWCLEAVCPPPKEHMHILGRVAVAGMPSRDV